MRHSLPTVLSLAVTGVLAGCRSLTALWEHATDLTGADLEALGLQEGQALPSESTIRRVLQGLDPADVDAHLEDRNRCTPATAPRSWPLYVTWPPGLIRLVHGAGISIASTTRSLSRQPTRAIKLLTRPTTSTNFADPWCCP